jgi:hypothetical protein
MSKEEEQNLPIYLAEYKNSSSFFDFKYYSNKFTLTLEILLFILMLFFIIIFALEYIWIIFVYFLGLFFHLSRHFHLKKKEKS